MSAKIKKNKLNEIKKEDYNYDSDKYAKYELQVSDEIVSKNIILDLNKALKRKDYNKINEICLFIADLGLEQETSSLLFKQIIKPVRDKCLAVYKKAGGDELLRANLSLQPLRAFLVSDWVIRMRFDYIEKFFKKLPELKNNSDKFEEYYNWIVLDFLYGIVLNEVDYRFSVYGNDFRDILLNNKDSFFEKEDFDLQKFLEEESKENYAYKFVEFVINKSLGNLPNKKYSEEMFRFTYDLFNTDPKSTIMGCIEKTFEKFGICGGSEDGFRQQYYHVWKKKFDDERASRSADIARSGGKESDHID